MSTDERRAGMPVDGDHGVVAPHVVRTTCWCPFCFKDVPESDTDHNVEDGELIDCNVYGRSL